MPELRRSAKAIKEKAAPKLAEFGKEKLVPALEMAGRKAVLAGRWAAPRASNVMQTAYAKTMEQIARAKWRGNTVYERAGRIGAEATGKAMIGIRIAHALVKKGYSTDTALEILEKLHEAAKKNILQQQTH